MNMNKRFIKRGIITTIILLSIGIISLPVYFIFSPEISNFFNRTDFDRKTWINWEETETTACLRWDMTHDLLKKYDLLTMSESELVELLGDPDSKNKTTYRYYLGMSRHGIDTGSLIITIKDEKVIEYDIWHG